MNFKHLLSALRARHRIFFLILATTLAVTIVISLVVPKTYVAKASLLLDGKDEQSMRNTSAPPERERAGYMQTQLDIITSPKVAYRVIDALKLAESPLALLALNAASGAGSIDDRLVENLLKQIKVDTSQSSLIQISFSSTDPKFSALIANGFAKAYVDTVLELRVEPTRQTSVWFDEQLKGLRDNMEQAERRLTNFQQEHGIVTIDERYDVDNIQLTDLAGQVARAPSAPSAETGKGHAGSTARETLPEIMANPGIQSLKTDLLRAEAKLQEISSELGSKHPQYLRQLAEVQSLRERVDSEIRTVLAGTELAVQRSRQHKQRLLGEMAAQRERVLGLKQARNELAVLSHEVDIAQRTYDAAMQRFLTSKIESHALQTNVRVLDPALPPAKPAHPKLGLNISLAALIGTLLGLAAVRLMEMFDQRVRLLDDLVGDPSVPLLAVLNTWDPAEDRLLGSSASRHALPSPG